MVRRGIVAGFRGNGIIRSGRVHDPLPLHRQVPRVADADAPGRGGRPAAAHEGGSAPDGDSRSVTRGGAWAWGASGLTTRPGTLGKVLSSDRQRGGTLARPRPT